MVLSHLSPHWFFGYDVAFELSFAIISLIVSLFAFRIYKKTSQRSVKFFSISFLLIAISYFIQSIFNFLVVSKLNENVCRIIKIQSVAAFEYMGIITHILFMTIGLSILLYTTLKDKRLRMFWLLLVISLTSIFFSKNIMYMFFLISTIYLGFISWHFILNYLNNKQAKTLLIAMAFLFLLFGNFHFLISVNHQLFYVIGHILEFFAYIFILINLYLVHKR